MAERQKDPCTVTLKNVRLSFAHLYKPQSPKNGDGEPKYNCNFLIDPQDKIGARNLDLIEDAIAAAKDAKWKDKPPKLSAAKLCLRDGNDVDYDGYQDMMYLSASNAKKPRVLDRDKLDVAEGDEESPYSGCYVDAIVRVWAQDNDFGKRVNCSLEAVRFRDDGEAFGAAPVDVDAFDDLDDDGDRASRRRGRDEGRRTSRDEEDDDRDSSRRRSSRDEEDEDRGSSRRRTSRDEEDDDRGSSRRRSSRDEEDEDRGSSRRRTSRDEEDDDRGSSRRRSSRDEEDEDRGSSRRRTSRDEEDDDRDSSRRRTSRDEEDDDRGSSRRRSSRDEEDDEDRPSRNSRAERRGRRNDDIV